MNRADKKGAELLLAVQGLMDLELEENLRQQRVALIVLDEWQRLGTPKLFISDNGPAFNSAEVHRSLLEVAKAKLARSGEEN